MICKIIVSCSTNVVRWSHISCRNTLLNKTLESAYSAAPEQTQITFSLVVWHRVMFSPQNYKQDNLQEFWPRTEQQQKNNFQFTNLACSGESKTYDTNWLNKDVLL